MRPPRRRHDARDRPAAPDHFRNLDVQYLPEDCLQWPDDHTFEQVTAERAVAA